MKLRFWGVRGSTPTPSLDNYRYGGNTPCLEVRLPEGELLIFDGGSGMRMLGKQLMVEYGHGSINAFIFLTHYHWDHIQGIPFFEPLYNPENSIHFRSFSSQALSAQDALADQMSYPYFPVDMGTFRAKRTFSKVDQDSITINDAVLKTAPLNHPQGCLGFRLESEGKVLVYATDNEPGSPIHDENVRRLAKGADVLIYDAQYTPLEYSSQKKGWGHSTWREGVNIAAEMGVKQLILFHHDPDHNDSFVDSIQYEARKFFPNSVAAWEGMEIDLSKDEHTQPQDREKRRSGNRKPARVPLKVNGKRADGSPFEEETILENLSVQGAYFLLENDPDPDGELDVTFNTDPGTFFGQPFQFTKSQLVRNQTVEEDGIIKRGIAVMFR
ncbi:MAG: hypothetical protein A3F68_02060 [Acidobacteria bacterium RIFCSPLOWO2_12_FULL_54_10]|nr:MAG: hypothetical protein A3F68_02060 [Acidobacteria bacterium RIFCSPLOWO2_12_FULL_54_10]